MYYNIILNRNRHHRNTSVVLTLRAKCAAAWTACAAVARVAAGFGGDADDDGRAAGTTVAPACGAGFDVPSGGDRDDVSSGSRCCLARR